ncbi:MAG: hypothetical protein JRM82_03970 [Nitrososphaerota archaeon]|nr:hypothetical protein [Nitrososphaerota archaeon]
MKSSVRLKVVCADEAVAARLESVLAPDNLGVPADQTFSMRRTSRTLSFEVSSPRPRSPLSTLHSVLTDIALFREIWLISPRADASGRGGTGC